MHSITLFEKSWLHMICTVMLWVGLGSSLRFG